MKKLFASLLAVMLLASMLVLPTSADETYTITITNQVGGNVYYAYQVFAGMLDNNILSDVTWGSGVNSVGLLAALKGNETFNNDEGVNVFTACTTALNVAEVIDDWNNNEVLVKTFADVVANNLIPENYHASTKHPTEDKYTISGLEAGYYLVKTEEAGADGYTDYILQVVNDVTITPKVSVPSFSKMVNNVLGGTYRHGMDFQIGDEIYFKLEGTLPSMLAEFGEYKYIITDVINTDIFKVDPDNLVQAIYLQHASGNPDTDLTDRVTPNYDESTHTLTVDFGNIKNYTTNVNDKIVVKIKVTLVGQPVTGNEGNENTASLTYSNNPNEASGATTATIDDGASIYTYGIEVTKVDSATTVPLQGAQFILHREIAENNTQVDYYAVIEGGYVSGWTPFKDASADGYSEGSAVASVVTSDSNGLITIKGLDNVHYHLTEVAPPSGYNSLTEPVHLDITSTIDATSGNLTTLSASVDSSAVATNRSTGLASFSIANNSGTTLPSTGGMGTTLFYVVGLALMVGAAAVIVVKKRETK